MILLLCLIIFHQAHSAKICPKDEYIRDFGNLFLLIINHKYNFYYMYFILRKFQSIVVSSLFVVPISNKNVPNLYFSALCKL